MKMLLSCCGLFKNRKKIKSRKTGKNKSFNASAVKTRNRIKKKEADKNWEYILPSPAKRSLKPESKTVTVLKDNRNIASEKNHKKLP